MVCILNRGKMRLEMAFTFIGRYAPSVRHKTLFLRRSSWRRFALLFRFVFRFVRHRVKRGAGLGHLLFSVYAYVSKKGGWGWIRRGGIRGGGVMGVFFVRKKKKKRKKIFSERRDEGTTFTGKVEKKKRKRTSYGWKHLHRFQRPGADWLHTISFLPYSFLRWLLYRGAYRESPIKLRVVFLSNYSEILGIIISLAKGGRKRKENKRKRNWEEMHKSTCFVNHHD